MWTEIDSAGASSGGGDSVSDSIAMLFSDIIVNQKSYGDEECMTTSYVMTCPASSVLIHTYTEYMIIVSCIQYFLYQ